MSRSRMMSEAEIRVRLEHLVAVKAEVVELIRERKDLKIVVDVTDYDHRIDELKRVLGERVK
jgi:GTP-binding protein EngB required for normal cell division